MADIVRGITHTSLGVSQPRIHTLSTKLHRGLTPMLRARHPGIKYVALSRWALAPRLHSAWPLACISPLLTTIPVPPQTLSSSSYPTDPISTTSPVFSSLKFSSRWSGLWPFVAERLAFVYPPTDLHIALADGVSHQQPTYMLSINPSQAETGDEKAACRHKSDPCRSRWMADQG